MTRAVAVLNLRDFMPPKARNSIRHACMRWGCAFLEITKPIGRMHHFWQKAWLQALPGMDAYEQVLQLDGDMLVRSDCPSPFELVPLDHMGVVSRVQPGIGMNRFEGERKMRWCALMGVTPYPEPRHHLNAGFILYSPLHHNHVFEALRAVGKRCRGEMVCPIPEQLALSCLLQSLNVPTVWLPWQYNTVRAGKRRQARPGRMMTYIYHFNGPRGRNLPAEVARCQWNVG